MVCFKNRAAKRHGLPMLIMLIALLVAALPLTVIGSTFSQPDSFLTTEQKMDFVLGKSLFEKLWVSSPSSTTASDGLGPLYNARSCLQCHPKNGRGRPTEANNPADVASSMLVRLGLPSQAPEPNYGSQFQTRAVQGVLAEGAIQLAYTPVTVTLDDGEVVTLRKPNITLTQLNYGALHPDTQLSARIAPAVIGLGLLEKIPDDHIIARADPEDTNNDGISGRINEVVDFKTGEKRLGRFGWKAGQPTLLQQNSIALFTDIGISSPMFTSGYGDCTPLQARCRQLPNGNSAHMDDAEASGQMVALITTYTQHLMVPKRRIPDVQKADIDQGEALFSQLGCQNCHTPNFSFTTDKAQRKTINVQPYTDLLLHDLGEGLADHRPEQGANGREWRTAPLWGIGLAGVINDHRFFLHDGRARTLQEAILWHGGEAEQSTRAYRQLSKAQRQQLIQFLESL